MVSTSTGLFESTFKPEYFTTIAFIFLCLNTLPVPPLPACFKRATFLRLSQKEKFRQVIKTLSAAFPLETTDTN